MTDIFDIKDIILPFPISIINTIFVCIVFLVIYFLLFRKNEKFVEVVEEVEEEKIDFREIILSFEKNYLLLESKDFLKEISFIFRYFLEQDLWYENFSKLTLDEIHKVKSWKLKAESQINHIFKVLEIIYFKEYKEEELTDKQKEKIFLDVKDIILNREK